MSFRVVYLFLILMTAASVFGQLVPVEYPTAEEPCFWNGGTCFDYQNPQYGGYTGTAPGITTCTTNVGCKACVIPDGQRQLVCATVPEGGDACKCEMTPGCTTSGACEYRP
jgi:hypothetical protein